MDKVLIFFVLEFCVLLISTIPSWGQETQQKKRNDYGLFFVTTEYDYWQDLPVTAKDKVNKLVLELSENYDFNNEIILNPTRIEIFQKLREYESKKYEKNDQLLIYFYQHGYNESEETSAIIPKDGKLTDPFFSSWIRHPLLLDLISRIPCEHQLLVLGKGGSSSQKGERGNPQNKPWEEEKNCQEKIEDALKYKSQFFLTQADDTTESQDYEFIDNFLSALTLNNQDGILSFYELLPLLETTQVKPKSVTLKNHVIGGNFVFVHKENCKNGYRENILSEKGNMVLIKGGTFQMGEVKSDYKSEYGIQRVKLSDYYIGKYEVTFNEYDKFCMSTGKKKPEDEELGRGKKPVMNVSWYDAIAYCNWLSEQEQLQPFYEIDEYEVITNWKADGYRLPTEAEWEFAARSRGKDYMWSGTSSKKELKEFANYNYRYDITTEVGFFLTNELGLYDMSGNIKEWCWDKYGIFNRDTIVVNPRGAEFGNNRIVRGGSWTDKPQILAANYREKLNPTTTKPYLGFRIAKSVKQLQIGEKDSLADNSILQKKYLTKEAENIEKKLLPFNNMVLVKGGKFEMGSPNGNNDEKPVHTVFLDDFYIAKFEVTFDEFDEFCRATGRDLPKDNGWGRGKRPVIYINWQDAMRYCNWLSKKQNLEPVYSFKEKVKTKLLHDLLFNKSRFAYLTGENQPNSNISKWIVTANWGASGYRLPTEAEWEFAAKNRGQKMKWSGTNTEEDLSEYANFTVDNNPQAQTLPVGTLKPNGLGLYDMSGNVWEWCWDFYDEFYYDKVGDIRNPRGAFEGSFRIRRGGSWNDGAFKLRNTNRIGYSFLKSENAQIGFRLARSKN